MGCAGQRGPAIEGYLLELDDGCGGEFRVSKHPRISRRNCILSLSSPAPLPSMCRRERYRLSDARLGSWSFLEIAREFFDDTLLTRRTPRRSRFFADATSGSGVSLPHSHSAVSSRRRRYDFAQQWNTSTFLTMSFVELFSDPARTR